MAHHHICPWWMGYWLINPLRRLTENPQRMLDGLVRPATTALDVGCGMGYFSLPMARMVGPGGKVVCVDLQQKMLAALERRARKAGLLERLDLRRCGSDSLGLDDLQGRIDFALAAHVAHEVPDQLALFAELHRAVKPGGRLLLLEPKSHVSAKAFAGTEETARSAGFATVGAPPVRRGLATLLGR
jgi:ubiquinone/menaquinone biosynthesis C-methylase UbiE